MTVLRVAPGRNALPSAAIVDSRTLQATPESGTRAGYDGAKRRRDSQVHLAVDTLGPLLALPVTAANEQDRSHVHTLAEKVQAVTGGAVDLPTLTKGTWGRKRPRPIICSWQSSSCPKPRKALYCCPSAGWWSVVMPGQRAFAAWHGMMNSWPSPLLACMLRRSLS